MSFEGYIREDTAVTVKVGPFVDSTDGNTAETALTILPADVRLTKKGGNMAAKNQATNGVHDELGYYDIMLDVTDTDTPGLLKLIISMTGALIVNQTYQVQTQAAYDALHGSAASPDTFKADVTNLDTAVSTRASQTSVDALNDFDPATDTVNVGELLGDAGSAAGLRDVFNGTGAPVALTRLSISANDPTAAVVVANSHLTGDGIKVTIPGGTGSAATFVNDLGGAAWLGRADSGVRIFNGAIVEGLADFQDGIRSTKLTIEANDPTAAVEITNDDGAASLISLAGNTTAPVVAIDNIAGTPSAVRLAGAGYGLEIENTARMLALLDIRGGAIIQDTVRIVTDDPTASVQIENTSVTGDGINVDVGVAGTAVKIDGPVQFLDDVTYSLEPIIGITPWLTVGADRLLTRDWTAVGSPAARSVLNSLRAIRNRKRINVGTLQIFEEDDTTVAWSGPVTTDPLADPIIEIDPT